MSDDPVLVIESIPVEDGFYWYYQLGKSMPEMVAVGEYQGSRAIKNGAVIQRFWYPGEFFVGPIKAPFATPEELANPTDEQMMYAHENPLRSASVEPVGPALN